MAFEGVQLRTTRMMKEIRRLLYEKRLEVLGLYSLERKLKRGGVIQAFKISIIKEIGNAEHRTFFQFGGSKSTRGK